MSHSEPLDGMIDQVAPLRYRERRAAALAELASRGVEPWRARPPLYRALCALGLPLRPPYYMSLLGATLYHAVLVVPAIGMLFWMLIWRHDAVSPLGVVPSVLQIAALPSVALALLTRFRAWRSRRTPWHELQPQTADDAA